MQVSGGNARSTSLNPITLSIIRYGQNRVVSESKRGTPGMFTANNMKMLC